MFLWSGGGGGDSGEWTGTERLSQAYTSISGADWMEFNLVPPILYIIALEFSPTFSFFSCPYFLALFPHCVAFTFPSIGTVYLLRQDTRRNFYNKVSEVSGPCNSLQLLEVRTR